MITNGRLLESGTVLHASYCVVGSGMGGAAVAQKLIESGEHVLIIEAGGLQESDRHPAVTAEHVGRPFGLPLTRCIQLGGSSSRWHGICAPLDEIDFEPRPWIRESGWPIQFGDLEKYYVEACRKHGVPGARYFAQDTVPPIIRQRLTDLEYDRKILAPKIVQFRNAPLRWLDTLVELARSRGLNCVIEAPALELITDESGTRVEKLVIGVRGGTALVDAEVFVICAGALETPRLLLNSHRSRPTAIGNEHGFVGRFLSDHPMGHFNKIGFTKPIDAPAYASQQVGGDAAIMSGLMVREEQQTAQSLPNHHVWLRPSVTARRIDDETLLSFLAVRSARDLSLRQIKAIVTSPDLLYRILVHHFGFHPKYRYGDMFFMTEQLPNPNSAIRLSTLKQDAYGYPIAEVDWRLTEDDYSEFQRYAKLLFTKALSGKQYKLARKDDPDVWRRTLTSAAHHLGTARMAKDAAHGVVDRNLQVFGMSNLFVCDGSVFPTVGSVNPSLTITALGLRLADYLTKSSRTTWSGASSLTV